MHIEITINCNDNQLRMALLLIVKEVDVGLAITCRGLAILVTRILCIITGCTE